MITSRQNNLIKAFRNFSDSEHIVVEGAKLVSEAVDAGFVCKSALFTEKAIEKYPDLFARLREFHAEVISGDLAEYISDTKTPQGVFVMFERKTAEIGLVLKQSEKLLILDGVRDPGNFGAIVRSCEAFGWDGIVCSGDSADIYNPKVIRAAAGSVFRLPNVRGSLLKIIPELGRLGFKVWASALDGNAVSLKSDTFSRGGNRLAVVIGNEGKGVSGEVIGLCDGKLYIPIKGVESLNASVAAGIICYVLGD